MTTIRSSVRVFQWSLVIGIVTWCVTAHIPAYTDQDYGVIVGTTERPIAYLMRLLGPQQPAGDGSQVVEWKTIIYVLHDLSCFSLIMASFSTAAYIIVTTVCTFISRVGHGRRKQRFE